MVGAVGSRRSRTTHGNVTARRRRSSTTSRTATSAPRAAWSPWSASKTWSWSRPTTRCWSPRTIAAQDVSRSSTASSEASRTEHVHHTSVYRPWGHYEGDRRGRPLPGQAHHRQAGREAVAADAPPPRRALGRGRRARRAITSGDRRRLLSENESTYIPIGANHRLENPGKTAAHLIEVQSGSLPGRGRHRPLRGHLRAQGHQSLMQILMGL